MTLKNINPATTNAWKELSLHFNEIKEVHLRDLLNENPNRKEDFSIDFKDFNVDYSKNRITQKTIDLLISLADQTELKDAISKKSTKLKTELYFIQH
jgi:glucose-6-phosphate isomerase